MGFLIIVVPVFAFMALVITLNVHAEHRFERRCAAIGGHVIGDGGSGSLCMDGDGRIADVQH